MAYQSGLVMRAAKEACQKVADMMGSEEAKRRFYSDPARKICREDALEKFRAAVLRWVAKHRFEIAGKSLKEISDMRDRVVEDIVKAIKGESTAPDSFTM